MSCEGVSPGGGDGVVWVYDQREGFINAGMIICVGFILYFMSCYRFRKGLVMCEDYVWIIIIVVNQNLLCISLISTC